MVQRHFWQPSSFRPTFSIALAIVCSGALVLIPPPPAAQAQSFFERVQSLFTRRRAEDNASGRARGGAVRDSCPNLGDRTLLALIPQSNVGKTVSAFPTFWFYVSPGDADQTVVGKFELLDDQENEVLTTPILVSVPSTGGIVSLQLPETEQPLEVEKGYTWSFSLICDGAPSAADANVNGWVKRVPEPSQLSHQLAATSFSEQYQVYAEYDLWFDTLTRLAHYYTTHPEDWANLLALFELSDVDQISITRLHPQTDCPTGLDF